MLLIEAGGSEFGKEAISIPLKAPMSELTEDDWSFYTVPQKKSTFMKHEQVLPIIIEKKWLNRCMEHTQVRIFYEIFEFLQNPDAIKSTLQTQNNIILAHSPNITLKYICRRTVETFPIRGHFDFTH